MSREDIATPDFGPLLRSELSSEIKDSASSETVISQKLDYPADHYPWLEQTNDLLSHSSSNSKYPDIYYSGSKINSNVSVHQKLSSNIKINQKEEEEEEENKREEAIPELPIRALFVGKRLTLIEKVTLDWALSIIHPESSETPFDSSSSSVLLPLLEICRGSGISEFKNIYNKQRKWFGTWKKREAMSDYHKIRSLGAVYCNGFSYWGHPILICRGKFIASLGRDKFINVVVYVISLIKAHLLQPGKVEQIVIIIDMEFCRFYELSLFNFIHQINLLFCGLIAAIFLIKCDSDVFQYVLLSNKDNYFFYRNLHFVSTHQYILQFIDSSQLEINYGGVLPSLRDYVKFCIPTNNTIDIAEIGPTIIYQARPQYTPTMTDESIECIRDELFQTLPPNSFFHRLCIKRKIFSSTEGLLAFERMALEELTKVIPTNQEDQNLLLRLIHSSQGDILLCVKRLQEIQSMRQHQIEGEQFKKLSGSGLIYQFGCSRYGEPVIIIQPNMIDNLKFADALACASYLLESVKAQLFIDGIAEQWLIMIKVSQATDVPTLCKFLNSIDNYFPCYTSRYLLIDAEEKISNYLHGLCPGVRSLIKFISINNIKEWIDLTQLETHYGGDAVPAKNYSNLRVTCKTTHQAFQPVEAVLPDFLDASSEEYLVRVRELNALRNQTEHSSHRQRFRLEHNSVSQQKNYSSLKSHSDSTISGCENASDSVPQGSSSPSSNEYASPCLPPINLYIDDTLSGSSSRIQPPSSQVNSISNFCAYPSFAPLSSPRKRTPIITTSSSEEKGNSQIATDVSPIFKNFSPPLTRYRTTPDFPSAQNFDIQTASKQGRFEGVNEVSESFASIENPSTNTLYPISSNAADTTGQVSSYCPESSSFRQQNMASTSKSASETSSACFETAEAHTAEDCLVDYFPKPEQQCRGSFKQGTFRRMIFSGVHLKPFEENAVAAAYQALHEKGVALEGTNFQSTAEVLRFLQGCNWNVETFMYRCLRNLEWRASQFPISISNFMNEKQQLHALPVFYICGRDRRFRPIIIGRLRNFSPGSADFVFQTLIYWMEYIIKSKLVPGKIEQITAILDFRGLSVFSLPAFNSTYIRILQKHYPSRLHRVFVVNMTPPIRLWWNMFVNPIIVPHTKDRIIILGDSYSHELKKDISRTQLENSFGGKVPNVKIEKCGAQLPSPCFPLLDPSSQAS